MKSGDLLFGNPASQHSDGKASRKAINQAREKIFTTFGLSEKTNKLFFHSGATEGIHSFARSFAEETRLKGQDLLICYASTDHPCVLALAETFLGSHVKFLELKLDQKLGYLHEENFKILLDKKENNPELVILYHHLWVHNETGVVSPLEDLLSLKKIPDLFLHIDAVQSPGKILEWKTLSVGDAWTYSAHKFGALKGLGFSLFKAELPFHPLMTGGGQQSSLRSGTENPMAVWSLKLALEDLEKIDLPRNLKLRRELEEFFTKELEGLGSLPFKDVSPKNANTVYFYFDELTSDIALALFDLHGLEISAGSACSSGTARDSVVMQKLGLGAKAKNGLRLSFGRDMSEEDWQLMKTNLQTVFQKIQNSL